MIPKEKAQELVDKFLPLVYCYMGSGMLSDDYDKNVALGNAKQCALIAVDEIISLNCENYSDWQNNPHHYYSREYWQQVKKEINKL